MVLGPAVLYRPAAGLSAMRALAIFAWLVVNFAVWSALPSLALGGGVLVRVATLLALMFVATLVHELGHAAAVRWQGGQVKVIMVTPFRLQLSPRRFRLAKPAGRGDLGGYVSYTLDRIDARRGHAIIAAAGPAANIALAALAMLVVALLAEPHVTATIATGVPPMMPDARLPSDAAIQAWFARRQSAALGEALAVVSFGMALLNLIPFRGSDGDHILYAISARYRRSRIGSG